MNIAVTGGTGFIGRYLLNELLDAGHQVVALKRPSSKVPSGLLDHQSLTWMDGDLTQTSLFGEFVKGADAVIHAALWRPGQGFRGAEGDVPEFAQVNVIGTLQLIEAARAAKVERFVAFSTCAVHEEILDDRPLDEAHPVWPKTHYGAHKGAIECFVHSYGKGEGYPIAALRPSGVYGRHHRLEESKWFELIRDIVEGRPVQARRGGKEVHAVDVAKACVCLLNADRDAITGEVFNCCDGYVSHFEIAELAKNLSESAASIDGEQTKPKHQINSEKLQKLGFSFGGDALWKSTVAELVEAIQADRVAANK